MRQALVFSPIESAFEHDQNRSNADFDLFWKEILPEGVWKHPNRGFTLNADKKRLDSLAANFQKQKKRGIAVPVPYGHKYDTSSNAGFVEEVEVREKPGGKFSLFGLLNIPRKEDSGKLNETVKDVSPSIHPNLPHSTEDGKVEELGECLEHVALTNYPVIAGLQDFVAFDTVGETVTVVHLDAVGDVPLKGGKEGFTLNPEQLKGFTKEIAQVVLTALGVERISTSGQQLLTGGKDMSVTPEQLRVMEQKFSLKENSLTEENWFDAVNKLDLTGSSEAVAAAKKADEEAAAKKVEEEAAAAKKKADEEEGQKFDIAKDPKFQELQRQNQILLLDRNSHRLATVNGRLGKALESGRINKAAFDKIVPEDGKLQFSKESCFGDEWDSWVTGIEAQLDVVEQLPEGHSVSINRITAGHTSNQLSQRELDEEKQLDKDIDEAIKSATPQNHPDNVQFDTKSGIFVAAG